MSDPRVAVAQWAPRFLADGLPADDVEDLRAAIERGEDWCRAWSARAGLHEALGKDCLGKGYRLSAGEHLARAALCYHFAGLLPGTDERQRQAARLKAAEAYDAALPCLRPPGEKVRIASGKEELQAVLRLPPSPGRAPVLVMLPDVGSAKEELHAEQEPFLARGIAVLSLDGGEQAAAAALEWIGRQTDLDAANVGIWGIGLGAGSAARAAESDPRFKACIAIGGPVQARPSEGLLVVGERAHRHRSRSADWLAARFGLPRS